MKQFLRHIFLLVAIFMATTLPAQTYNNDTWYSLDPTKSYTLSTIDDEVITVFSPTKTNLTFEAKRDATGAGNMKVAPIISGTQQANIFDSNPGKVTKTFLGIETQIDYVEYSATTPVNLTQLKFYTTIGATYNKYIKNIKLPLAKHILLNDNTTNGTTWGVSSITLTDNSLATAEGHTSSSYYTIKFRSFLASGNITITSNNTEFHFGKDANGNPITQTSLGTSDKHFARIGGTASKSSTNLADQRNVDDYETKVYFSPKKLYNKDNRSATITITDGTSTAYIYISAPIIPTYYFSAQAIACVGDTPSNDGGTATATFPSGLSTDTIIATSYTTTSMQLPVTFKAAPNSANGYVYDGWKKQPTDEDFHKKGDNTQSFTETITSSALNPNNLQPQLKYYAIFTKRYNPIINNLQNYTNQLVGTTIENIPYLFIDAATQYPTNSDDDDFYFDIEHRLDGGSTADCPEEHKDKVIDYYPQEKKIIARNAGTATITFYHKSTDTHNSIDPVSVTITVIRHTPTFTWYGKNWNEPTTEYFNQKYPDYFVSSSTTNNTSATLTYSSSDPDAAELLTGSTNQKLDLQVYYKENDPLSSINLTVSQAQNYYWDVHSETHTITPKNPNNHVEFTLTQENYINVFQETYNDPYAGSNGPHWSDGGIRFGKNDITDGGWNWADKYIVIEFTGVPDSLFFSTTTSGAATTKQPGTSDDGRNHLYFYVAEKGINDTDFTEIWNSSKEENSNVAIKLSPDTRLLKLCYTGNLEGWFKGTNKYSGVTVTELNHFDAVDINNDTQHVTHLDFGKNQVFTDKTLSFDIKYANAGYKVKLESTDPHFTVSPSAITDIGGEKYGKRRIDVTYTSIEPYETPADAKIIISDEVGHRDSVYLYASSYKVEQRINWRADFEAIEEPSIRIKNGDITNAATATSQLPVTYTSSNPEVIEVINNGTALRPVAEGEAKITASQAGNETWQPAKPSTKTFIVTDKLLQYIVWDDNLTNIIKDDTNPQTLTLTARVYLQLEGGAIEFSQEKTNQLIYQSGNDNVVSVNGNTLTINNVGRTTLTATIEGDDNYATATLSKTVIVRSATLGCEDNLLYEHTGDPIQFFQMNLNEIIKDPIALNLKQGIPGYVTLAHYGESWNLGVQYYAAEIRVEQSLDNGNNWQPIQTISPIKDQENVDTIPLSRQATHIRFVRNSGGQGYQFLYNIDVHPAQYIEAQDIVDFGQIHVGSQETRTFTLYYSNIKHALSPVPSTTEITATPKTIGECSGFDTVDVSVTWLPTQVNENATATITFTDPNSGMEKVVTLKAKVVMGTQNIVWDNIPTVIEDCGDINFPEKTTASLPITWTVIEGNQFADFNEDGMLEIYRNGTITVQATQEGTGNYKPLDPVTYTFAIQLNIAFVGTEDSEWSNPNNWAMCRLPYADEVATIEVPAILSMHDTIAGIIFATSGDAQKGSIHITSTGGLTVGEQGITNAANDGSSILIDNKPNGAGFLLISPNANEENKYPQFTMNYTTRAFNEGVPRDETWQYMGAPGNNAKFKFIDDQTLIYHWDETKGWIQKSNSELNPIPTWQGYALTQSVKTNHNYQITAQAIQGSQTINLTKTDAGMKGDNLFVNSFTAPIDITKIDPETDITGTWDYQTFYLFNTGSWNEWQGVNTDHKHDASSPGHYYTIPIRSAKYLDDAQTIVPPMQGIYVHTEAEASITLDYTKHVWNGTPGNTPMRAPQKQDPDFRRIRIQASSQNSGADRMYIIQEASTTRGYDNGYDGKNINANGQVNIYTNEPFGKMEVSCANNIDSMYIGFRAGSDSEYQLIFSSLIGDSLYLKDLDNNTIIHMEEGGKYHFFATPNSINNSRFQILLHPSEVSDDDTTTDDNQLCQTNIWIENYHLHITNAPINSRAIIYAVSGQQVASYSVNNAYYTIPLSSLNNGIYILQLNNQRYKFVCK